jgi:hypothetical protein
MQTSVKISKPKSPQNAKPATLLGASGFETNYPSMAKSAGQI